MVEQSTLLQIIQFVGLITPALAILIELLIRFHGGIDRLQESREIPIEIQILFLGFSAILLGGMGIGVQMTLTLDNRITQIASLLIFGGLPFLAISVLAMHIRISVVSAPDTSIIDQFVMALRRGSSVGIPLILTSLIYIVPINWFYEEIGNLLSWWVFKNGLHPGLYFYSSAVILVYKVMYSLWTHQTIPTENIGEVLNDWFVVCFTMGAFFVLLSSPIFAIYYGLLSFESTFITSQSVLSAIPYIWGGLVLLVALYTDVDPNSD